MCYERRAWRQRTEEEESRRLWDVFHRETAEPPQQTEPEIRLESDEREGAREREPVER